LTHFLVENSRIAAARIVTVTYPIHVVCCDPLVSLQAIKVLVECPADVLAVVDGEQGLLPFHFAANWGARLDVNFLHTSALSERCCIMLEMLLLVTILLFPLSGQEAALRMEQLEPTVMTRNNDEMLVMVFQSRRKPKRDTPVDSRI
jgi:hypothetical protein